MVISEPVFLSWADFLARTSPAALRAWCATKAKVANRPKLLSGTPELRITTLDVWTVLSAGRGRCRYCGSLALERRPSSPTNGQPLPWEHVGRRIGSLDHEVAIIDGGANHADNLGWACLWCNTWDHQRIPGALDHGGLYVPVEPVDETLAAPWQQVTRIGRFEVRPR